MRRLSVQMKKHSNDIHNEQMRKFVMGKQQRNSSHFGLASNCDIKVNSKLNGSAAHDASIGFF